MDEQEKISKLTSFSKYRLTVNNQLSQIKEELSSHLVHSINGGTFIISPEIISFISVLIDKGYNSTVLIDKNNMPIKIDDLELFRDDILNKYTTITSHFYTKYNNVLKNRNIKKMYDIDE